MSHAFYVHFLEICSTRRPIFLITRQCLWQRHSLTLGPYNMYNSEDSDQTAHLRSLIKVFSLCPLQISHYCLLLNLTSLRTGNTFIGQRGSVDALKLSLKWNSSVLEFKKQIT